MSRLDKGSVKAWQQRVCVWQGLFTSGLPRGLYTLAKIGYLANRADGTYAAKNRKDGACRAWSGSCSLPKEILEVTVVPQFRGCGGEITGEPLLGASLQADRGRNADREQAFDRDVVST
jgi:hypothetical protein